MKFAWLDIHNFHSVRKLLKGRRPENEVMSYRGKVKLHGTNAGVVVSNDGTVTCLSRTSIISPERDNVGFAAFITKNKSCWPLPSEGETVVYGEWCGPGIQKGCAISQISEKIFAVFAAVRGDQIIIEPEQLNHLVPQLPNVYVLPWFNKGETFNVSWNAPAEDLEQVVNKLNSAVLNVEECDPWVRDTFNVSGIGEGLVMYPSDITSYAEFDELCFKAKGERHKVVASTKSVQIDPTVTTEAKAYAELVLQEARLEQGLACVGGPQLQNMGHFLKWIIDDVKKETFSEIEASHVPEKLLMNAVMTHAREWFKDKCNQL